MLILVPWKPFVFGWLLLTAMILAGYAVYCIQEGRNPFSVEKYHVRRNHSHHAVGVGTLEQKRKTIGILPARHDRAINGGDPGCTATTPSALRHQ